MYTLKNNLFKLLLILIVLYILFYIYHENIFYIKYPLNPEMYKKFLSRQEINLILDKCKNFSKSTINKIDKQIISTDRTSSSCFISNDEVHNLIRNKIKKLFNIKHNLELQLTYYNENEFYNNHHDYFDEHERKFHSQRIKTIFVYLKCPEEGGETVFPLLNKTFTPEIGDAILWTNCINNNNKYIYLKNSLHRGNKVKKGKKIGFNIWILDS